MPGPSTSSACRRRGGASHRAAPPRRDRARRRRAGERRDGLVHLAPPAVVVFHGNYAGYAKAIRPSGVVRRVRPHALHPRRPDGPRRRARHRGRGVAHRGRRDPPLLRAATRRGDRERDHARARSPAATAMRLAVDTPSRRAGSSCSLGASSTGRATTFSGRCRRCCPRDTDAGRRRASPHSSAPGDRPRAPGRGATARPVRGGRRGRAADALEGASYRLIEAQDAGLPLVTCRQGHVAEMLDREPALRPTVIPRLEAPLLAERVRLLLDDRRARAGGGRGRRALRAAPPRRGRYGRSLRRPAARPRDLAAPGRERGMTTRARPVDGRRGRCTWRWSRRSRCCRSTTVPRSATSTSSGRWPRGTA